MTTQRILYYYRTLFLHFANEFDLCEFGFIITQLTFPFANQTDSDLSHFTILDYQSRHHRLEKITNVLLF